MRRVRDKPEWVEGEDGEGGLTMVSAIGLQLSSLWASASTNKLKSAKDRTRERERQRKTERERERVGSQPASQTDRQTGRKTNRQTDRQTDRQTVRQKYNEGYQEQLDCIKSRRPNDPPALPACEKRNGIL